MMSNNVAVSIISLGSMNQSKSILIAANNERYLINCGEGTQKIMIENGMKIGALKNVFFTRKSQENMCGLIGIALGISYNNKINLTLHGYEKAIDVIKASKKFADGETCKITLHNNSDFIDKTFKIESFKYKNGGDEDECVGYLFSTKKMRPKINIVKCEALGVPKIVLKSKKMAEFLHKTHVQFEDGRIIESKDVLDNPQPAEKFLVIECPSLSHIPNLMNVIPFDNFNNVDENLSLVFHLTEKYIFNHESYQHFIKRINSNVVKGTAPSHVMIDSTVQFPTSYSTYYLQTCLNYFFDNDTFPKLKLYDDYIVHRKQINDKLIKTDEDNNCCIDAESFMEFNLNNSTETKNYSNEMWSKLKLLNEKDVIDEVLIRNEYFSPECMIEKMKQLKDEIIEKKKLFKVDSTQYPKVTFLGTSSSSPSKYRNISSILIETKSDEFVLFDCGEGTLDRIFLLFGQKRGDVVIRNLRLICISHNHLDHHSGLYIILRYREMMKHSKQCLILAAQNVQMFTHEMDTIFETLHCQFNCDWCRIDLFNIENNKFATDYPRDSINDLENELNILITPVRVFHTSTSYGFVLCGNNSPNDSDWKITYNGDRSPKFPCLVNEGMNCDLLIHEATMDDGLEEMAAKKYHSTVSQAIGEGIKMNAKFTMLTHFSSRHPLVPPVEHKYQNVAQAFDLMTVTLQSCHLLKVLDPYLEYLFPRHWYSLVNERHKRVTDCRQLSETSNEKKAKMD